MALKVYSYGFVNYWRDGQNRFDFVVTLVIELLEKRQPFYLLVG
ncbi:mitochondrial thiamine pyrophosphate transporter [Orobanche minor]